MKAIIFIEGGGDSKELHVRCREGFRKLLEKCGFTGRMPRLVACGGRTATFDDFKTEHARQHGPNYVAMLIDSETPLADVEAAWRHLHQREQWAPPAGATDEQVLFMTTCMETWIVADRPTLAAHYGHRLQVTALPPLQDLEHRSRQEVQQKLEHATRQCTNAYTKGKRSFEVLGKLSPNELDQLPSFRRVRRILQGKLS